MTNSRDRRWSPPPSFGHPGAEPPPPNRRARRAANARRRTRGGRGSLRSTARFALLAVVVGTGLVLAPTDLTRPGPVTASGQVTIVPASADTYVSRQEPNSSRGSHAVVTAAAWPDWYTEGYLKFTVPADAAPFRSVRLELTLDRVENLPDRVELRELPSSWAENETTWHNRPDTGRRLTEIRLDRLREVGKPGKADLRVHVDVSRWVTGPGSYAFALVNSQKHTAARFRAAETASGPRLVVSPDAPTPTQAPAAGPTADSPPVASSTVRPQAPAVPPTPTPSHNETEPDDGRLLCGVSLDVGDGQSHKEALAEAERRLGRVGMIREFYPGEPGAWPGRFADVLDGRPVVVSFKMDPRKVIAGDYDAKMTEWFETAPDDREVYWVYYHEPEDNIAAGEFTAADYRAAWRRLSDLADRADNPRLKATLVLMSWSLEPASKRNWRDYYPGRDVVDVLGWDTYNLAKSHYQSPEEMYEKVVEVSRTEDLPFGVAETGSYLIPGDTGSKRAAWLRDMVRYLAKKDALWVAYFDLNWPSGDFRLLDSPSITAWRNVC